MSIKTTISCSAAVVALAFSGTCLAQSGQQSGDNAGGLHTATSTGAMKTTSAATGAPKVSAADEQFIKNATNGGIMEVEMGKMAAKNATNADVKNFGNRMVTDHSRANAQLKSIAAKKGFELSSKPAKQTWQSDKAYMQMMVQDHQKDVAEFQKEAKNTTDPDLKQFASSTAKVIQGHLAMAKQINSKLK